MNYGSIIRFIFTNMNDYDNTDAAIMAEKSYRTYLSWHAAAFDDNNLSDKAFDIISDLVANAQRLAFERGVKTGARFSLELFR